MFTRRVVALFQEFVWSVLLVHERTNIHGEGAEGVFVGRGDGGGGFEFGRTGSGRWTDGLLLGGARRFLSEMEALFIVTPYQYTWFIAVLTTLKVFFPWFYSIFIFFPKPRS